MRYPNHNTKIGTQERVFQTLNYFDHVVIILSQYNKTYFHNIRYISQNFCSIC